MTPHIPDHPDAGAELGEELAGSTGRGEGVIVSVLITLPEQETTVVEPGWRIIVQAGEVVHHEGLAVVEPLLHL